jgi:hypothetical protein
MKKKLQASELTLAIINNDKNKNMSCRVYRKNNEPTRFEFEFPSNKLMIAKTVYITDDIDAVKFMKDVFNKVFTKEQTNEKNNL